VSGSRFLEIDAYATTTARELDATVTLTASYSPGIGIRISPASLTREIEAGHTNKFAFGSRITCVRSGVWPVTWTAKVSAARNSNPANDIITGTTQVVCAAGGDEHDD
jgi:hypothetical protein